MILFINKIYYIPFFNYVYYYLCDKLEKQNLLYEFNSFTIFSIFFFFELSQVHNLYGDFKYHPTLDSSRDRTIIDNDNEQESLLFRRY